MRRFSDLTSTSRVSALLARFSSPGRGSMEKERGLAAAAAPGQRSMGQVLCFLRQLWVTIDCALYGRRCGSFTRAGDAVQLAVHTIEPRLEPLLQTGEHPALERFDGFRLPGAAVFRNS